MRTDGTSGHMELSDTRVATIDPEVDAALDRTLRGRILVVGAGDGEQASAVRKLLIGMRHVEDDGVAPACIVVVMDAALESQLLRLRRAVEETCADAIVVTRPPDDWSAVGVDGEPNSLAHLDSMQMRVSRYGFSFGGHDGMQSAPVTFKALATFIRRKEPLGVFTDVTCAYSDREALAGIWSEERDAPRDIASAPSP